MKGWDAMDRAMLETARQRGPVLVLLPDNTEVVAALVCWRPKGSTNRARVTLPDGRTRTVGTYLVRPIPTCAPSQP